jgi:hypothetical protein
VTIVNGRITLQFLQNAKNAVLIGSLRRRQGRFRSINLHHFGFQFFRFFFSALACFSVSGAGG